MRSSVAGNRNPSAKALLFATFLWTAASLPIWAVSPGIRIVHDSDVLEVEAVAPNIVRVHFQPAGKVTPRTLVMDPAFNRLALMQSIRTRMERSRPSIRIK